MTRTRTWRAAGLCGLLLAATMPAAAQWPTFPTRNVPKNDAGEPDLTAPAPRTASRHVDFSGNSEARGGRPGGAPATGGGN